MGVGRDFQGRGTLLMRAEVLAMPLLQEEEFQELARQVLVRRKEVEPAVWPKTT